MNIKQGLRDILENVSLRMATGLPWIQASGSVIINLAGVVVHVLLALGQQRRYFFISRRFRRRSFPAGRRRHLAVNGWNF